MAENHERVFGDIKPHWLKTRLRTGESFAFVSRVVEAHTLGTICSSGRCPNRAECWNRRTATFLTMGDICTRACRFCATASGKPLPLDPCEPRRVADSVALMGLRHAVVTSVTRDDLPDHGAAHWAAVVAAIRKANPRTTIELLIPDMRGRREFVEIVAASKPDITGHNIECVRRLTGEVRSRASYRTSLHTLEHIAAAGTTTKSGLMVGLGETDNEVLQTLADLRRAGCRIVTIGQYLRPTPRHMAVSRYVHPEQFDLWREAALAMGFSYVAAGPLVRSSYMAEEALGCI